MTFLEKIKLEKPDAYLARSEAAREGFAFGCPCNYEYEQSILCPSVTKEELEKYGNCCAACWNREIPEDQIDLTMKGEKKTMKLASVIRDAVLNAICDSDIEDAVKEAFSNYDYSDMISSAVEGYLHYNIEDIAQETVAEAVIEYMAENL